MKKILNQIIDVALLKATAVSPLDNLFKEFDKQHNEGVPNLWEYDSRASVENFIAFCKLQSDQTTDNEQPNVCPNHVIDKSLISQNLYRCKTCNGDM